jgi:acyl carrier protein
LTREQILGASVESAAQWDSVATVTLFNVIEEEFGTPVDYDRIEELTSFARIRDYLGGVLYK